MSHNASHESVERLAVEVLSVGKNHNWSRNARVKFGLEYGFVLSEIDSALRVHFATAQLTDEQRASLKGSPFVK
jgi:hypothetical protein